MRRILFIANGHGETAIAARIARDVLAIGPGPPIACDLFPLVGTGGGAAGVTLVGPRRSMPSGGLVAMGNVRAFASDVRAGFLALLGAQLGFLREARDRYDVVVAVGDAYALALALRAAPRPIFVGTAKSVYVAPYGPFERTLLRRAAGVFVRDEPTARLLRRQGVAARAPGNVIVDLVHVEPAETCPALLGLLPGSRAAAYGDAVRLARVVREVGARRPGTRGRLSIAPTLESERFGRVLAGDGWRLTNATGGAFVAHAGETELQAWAGDLGTLLGQSVVVLGQAGTANEQAAACGVPVVALDDAAEGSGAWYRMRQRRLLGDALLLLPTDPRTAAGELAKLLDDPARLTRMGDAGRARMGPGGGSAAIAAAIRERAA